ncbi:hypothetical protein DL96DRAFT_1619600 [Flagelloscypha sp. PMI_526]|nr:hypothetical protein DL96DRAFT_1619600 [Flagelloscypha sp. PMI_526]
MTQATFRIDKSYLVGGWLASALWGMFTMLMAIAFYTATLTIRTKAKTISMSALSVLYILATVHISMVLVRLIQGFIDNAIPEGPGSQLYYVNIAEPINRIKDIFYVTALWISDGIIVWRCHMVWNQNYIVTGPLILLVMGTAACSYGAISQYFLTAPDPFVAADLGTSMFVLSMSTNIIVTILTASRIWWMMRPSRNGMALPSSTQFTKVLIIIVDSGLVISLAKLIEFILFKQAPEIGLVGFNALYIVFEAMPQLLGIVPATIIIAVNSAQLSTRLSHFSSSGGSKTFKNTNSSTSRIVFNKPPQAQSFNDTMVLKDVQTYTADV